MKHESLVAIKTFRDFKTGLENRSERKIRTTNSLCRTKKEQEILEALMDDKELSQTRQIDIQRFAQQDLAVKKSRNVLIATKLSCFMYTSPLFTLVIHFFLYHVVWAQ